MKMMGFIKQGIVSSQFFLFGKKHFTRTGYLKHVAQYKEPVQSAAVVDANEPTIDGVDLSGQTILVTGANQGIGKEIATYAAGKSATVYMLCRNKERAESAQKEIQDLTNNQNVIVLLADVSEPSQIKKVVSEFQGKEQKLDCLVCNAGALFNERKVNSEGKEITLMSHLACGSYHLTKLLLPSLKKASETNGGGSRVLYVTSGGMYNSKFPEWEEAASTGNFQSGYNGNMAYTYAKRGQVLLAERLTKENPDVSFVSGHPGWTKTAAVDSAFGSSAKYLEPMRNTWEGAEGICWLMATPKRNLEGGEFYLDRMPQRKHIAGPFMTDGTYTKNTEEEVDVMMKNLEETTGV
eukprot:CAMPEP_0172572912 /NCGR_PEP_ID=MMETSP1067-20121228/135922_1 /TAXON_ID=265564 ORGANISM="Thalassiosira punctigera, Strain Tpunct2005C2" /NCGR_SAMPLE_ID=MMETSP1067 /ASSEMBLY_ACC=CAM_ASM_000444 /LENGTH=350 /DNA_ID=CAMNT_0013365503 /DNA_START=56 /DNA_END=1108 /DNA_ORIENTATION=+